jgi:hypothetical protein
MQKSIENLQLAWRCILEGEDDLYKSIIVESPQQSGLHMFKFGGRGGRGHNGYNGGYNCEYYFVEIESDLWKKIDHDKRYDPSKHYEVCVSVPRFDLGDERIQSIRLFGLDDHKEVISSVEF